MFWIAADIIGVRIPSVCLMAAILLHPVSSAGEVWRKVEFLRVREKSVTGRYNDIIAMAPYLYGELLSLQFEGQAECIRKVAGQRVQLGQLDEMEQPCRDHTTVGQGRRRREISSA